MIEIGGDVEVSGPYSAQSPLEKAGSLFMFSTFILFGSFVPSFVAVALIAGVGEPADHWTKLVLAFGCVAATSAFVAGVS